MNYKEKRYLMALLIFAAAIFLGCLWYSWKLVLVIALFIWANNIELSNKKRD